MSLKNWTVIFGLLVIGLVLGGYYLSLPATPDGVHSKGDDSAGLVNAITALAASITTLAGAFFGIAMKVVDYRKAQLAIRREEIELDAKELELRRQRDQAGDGSA